MATNFNVSPYYDDFSDSKNFHRVLFRPAFAVQARELTQLQTILQNQVERFGEHVFKEGAMVIPGEVTLNTKYEYVKLASHSTSTASNMVGLTVTGATSGIEAEVVNSSEASSTAAATIYVIYKKTGTDNTTKRFTEGETLNFTFSSASATAVVGTSGTSLPTSSNALGFASSVNVQAGVYFVNGFFVSNSEETLILEPYSNTPSFRVGFTVTESFVTPEDDTSLNDNATGSSNINAPGAHRFKVALSLTKKTTTATDDTNFVETLARRTADESGDYVIQPFDIDVREHQLSGSNRGIFAADSSSLHDGLTSTVSEARLAIGLSPGKAYVKGFEVDTTSQKFVTIEKAREFDTIQNSTTRLDIGNHVDVTNIHGSPDIGTVSGETEAFKELSLFKDKNVTRGTLNTTTNVDVQQIGRAKPRFFEYVSGTAGSLATNTTSIYKLGLFNIDMFTHLGVTSSVAFSTGETITGGTSGASGIVEAITATTSTDPDQIITEDGFNLVDETDGDDIILEQSVLTTVVLSNVSGNFSAAETVTGGTSTNSGTTVAASPERPTERQHLRQIQF